jgi:hypothetical protein
MIITWGCEISSTFDNDSENLNCQATTYRGHSKQPHPHMLLLQWLAVCSMNDIIIDKNQQVVHPDGTSAMNNLL